MRQTLNPTEHTTWQNMVIVNKHIINHSTNRVKYSVDEISKVTTITTTTNFKWIF